MELIIVKDPKEMGKVAGNIILDRIKANPNLVLGLATGETQLTTYKYLVDDYKKNKTDWTHVTTFNLDEYVGLTPDNDQSYTYYMNNNLFHPINLRDDQTNIPLGVGDYKKFAKKYDKDIKKAGGIDLQMLGLGTNGHIGFNEPPCDFNSKTHVVDLVESTIKANSRFFENEVDVPKQAVSMGIKSIMDAKEVILLAYGKNKAKVIKDLMENDEITPMLPCSILRKHPNSKVIVDIAAASLLKK